MHVDLEKLTPTQFERFRAFIYRHCGIQIDSKKVTMLSNRIRRRLRASDFDNFDSYYQFLSSREGSQELSRFLDVVTTHETSFFRTPSQFDWLRQDFISKMTEDQRSGQRAAELKLWSAGCANGAEAYSMAICLLENAYRLRNWRLEIRGTDISQENITAAEHGVFKERALGLIPTDKRRQWLRHQADDLWAVRPAVKQLVQFACHNLMQPYSETKFDCVFIRNILIYFDALSKRRVVRNLLASLKSGGYLVIGPSEGVHDLLTSLERVSPLIYRKVSEFDQPPGHGHFPRNTSAAVSGKQHTDSMPRSPRGDL